MDNQTEILSEIKALAAHYPRRKLSPVELARWFEDYATDLNAAGCSPMDVRLACAGWRISTEKRMPSPGELIAKGKGMEGEHDLAASRLPVTVPRSLHDDVSEACGKAFAASYLSGATVDGDILQPKTRIARERLAARPEATRVLATHRIVMLGIDLVYSEEHKTEMRAKVSALAAGIADRIRTRGNMERGARETPAEQGERLWPNRRVDRVQRRAEEAI